MKKLTIMRGLPGSGKTIKVKEIAKDGAIICSADDFFVDADGNYNYDKSYQGDAHLWCEGKARYYMSNNHPHVIIDNTNVKKEHMKRFLDLAKEFEYQVQIVVVKADVETCIHRNIHQVPEEVIRKMAVEWEE